MLQRNMVATRNVSGDHEMAQMTCFFKGTVRACTVERRGLVSKRLESTVETDIKTDYTTERQGLSLKLFNALHVAKINL